jgi:hypothetical protein
MRDAEVLVLLQHKLDQWESSIDTFIRNQSEDELANFASQLINTIKDNTASNQDALLSMLALFGLIYVWTKIMKESDFEDDE